MNQFQTMSSARKNMRVCVFTWIIMAGLACFALRVTVAFFIFLEALIAIMSLFILLITARAKWIIIFEDDNLEIINAANKKSYVFDPTLKQSDFIFKQTATQKAKNCGDLRIKDCSAIFNDVQNFAELQAYINKTFQ